MTKFETIKNCLLACRDFLAAKDTCPLEKMLLEKVNAALDLLTDGAEIVDGTTIKRLRNLYFLAVTHRENQSAFFNAVTAHRLKEVEDSGLQLEECLTELNGGRNPVRQLGPVTVTGVCATAGLMAK